MCVDVHVQLSIGAGNCNSGLSIHLLQYGLCLRVAKALAKMLAELVLKCHVLTKPMELLAC